MYSNLSLVMCLNPGFNKGITNGILKWIFVFLFPLFFSFPVFGQYHITETLQGKIDSIVYQIKDQYDLTGLSIGLVSDDTIVYQKGYGVVKIELNNDVTANSVFHTASISKLFTAQAVVQLVNSNLISFDDLLIELAPELQFRNAWAKEIKIRHLLSHTSGLPDVKKYKWHQHNQSESALKEYIQKQKLKSSYQPGLKYQYSNLGYEILGYLIEKTTDQSFEDFAKENVLLPANMLISDFRYYKIPDSLRTWPHTKKGSSGRIITREHYPYNRMHVPSSTLNSSAHELCLWMIHFLKDVYPELEKQPLYGFQQYDFKSFEAVGHFGGDKGFRSFLMMVPDKEIGLILLGNCDYNEDYRQEIVLPIAQILLDQ
jgi:CubicO group peptidase (beta-lactamase class C family)